MEYDTPPTQAECQVLLAAARRVLTCFERRALKPYFSPLDRADEREAIDQLRRIYAERFSSFCGMIDETGRRALRCSMELYNAFISATEAYPPRDDPTADFVPPPEAIALFRLAVRELEDIAVLGFLPSPATALPAGPPANPRGAKPVAACTDSMFPSWDEATMTLTYAGKVMTCRRDAESLSEVFAWFQARQWAKEVKIEGYDIVEDIDRINRIVRRARQKAEKLGFTISRKGDVLKWSDPRLSAK
jgi:hypothetical protein